MTSFRVGKAGVPYSAPSGTAQGQSVSGSANLKTADGSAGDNAIDGEVQRYIVGPYDLEPSFLQAPDFSAEGSFVAAGHRPGEATFDAESSFVVAGHKVAIGAATFDADADFEADTPPKLDYIGLTDDSTDDTTYTFTDADIGDPHSTRLVIAAFYTDAVAARTISSVTIGGSAATPVASVAAGAGVLAIYQRKVTTGTTATIVVQFSDTCLRCRLEVWRLINHSSDTPADSDSTSAASGTGLSRNLDVPARGVVVAATNILQGGGFTVTWTGVTGRAATAIGGELTDASSGEYTAGESPETGRTISTSHANSTDNIMLACASWS